MSKKGHVIVWVAELQTQNFYFQAVGTTHGEAYARLLTTLRAHGRQHKLDDAWWGEFLDSFRYFEHNLTENLGGLRDGKEIK